MNRYESYRKTKIDWIGHIPKEWNLSRAKSLFRNKSQKNFPDEPLLSVTQKNGIVVRSESDINVWNPTDDVSGYKLIESGDFVISLRSFEGGIELSKVRGIVSSAYTVLEKQKEMEGHYFWWLMKSHQFIIELNKHVTGIRQGKNIGWNDFSNIYLTIPSSHEQKLISRYLDKKAEQMDSLIEKLQKKIKLLKEQRTSLINQCVTKGLNLNVETKDSGIQWIGEIPKHWKPTRLKYIGFLYGGLSGKSGDNFNQDDNQYNKPYIPFTNISDNTYISKDNLCEVIVYPGEVQNEVKQNDLFFLMSSEDYKGIGKSSVLRDDIGESYLNSFCKGFRITDVEYNSFFINYLLSGHSYRELLRIEGKGFTRINLQMNKINDLEIYVPPINEQKHISKYLDKESSKIDTIIEKEIKRVALLKEYRQSLISSVVTGKIRITEDMV